MSVRWPDRRGVDHPLRWNDLFSVPCAVMSEQAAKARVVAQHRIEAAVGKLEPFSVQEPLRVGFRADRFPYSIVQILGCRSVDGVMKHHSQHVRFDACVVVPCTGWCYATIELRNAPDCPLAGKPRPGDHVTPESVEIASTVPIFTKINSRRHMEEIPDWGHPVLRTLEARHIGFGFVVDRFNRPLGDRNPDQYAHDRFDHRLRYESIMVRPTILIAFEQDLIFLAHQQAGDGIARHVVGQGILSPANSISNLAKRAFEHPWLRGAIDLASRIERIKVAERANAVLRLPRIA